jgi:acyl-CoA thioester hydrolase
MPPPGKRERKKPGPGPADVALEHTTKLRVRFAETDALRVVYYAEYFVWFEVARTELFRSIGMPYTEVQKRGFNTPVVRASAEYKSFARYDDEIEIRARVTKVGRSSITLDFVVRKLPDKELLATGETVHVLIGEDGRSKPIPEDIKNKLLP